MPETIMRPADQGQRSLPRRLTLTNAVISGLTCPEGKDRVYVYDEVIRGMAVCITATGRKTFWYYFKQHGRPERVGIGKFPAVSVDVARKEVKKMAGERAQGKDPATERRAIKRTVTLQELWDKWKTEHADLQLRPRTIITDTSRFDTCFAGWKTRRIGGITEQDVRTLHAKIGRERGKTSANRAVQLLRRLLYFARLEPNPAAKRAVQLFHETSRSRFLKPDEMPKLFAAIDAEGNDTIRDYLYMSLWTAQRRSNVASMRWEHIDMDAATWTIPSNEAKAKEPIIVPLVPAAVDILKRRRPLHPGEYVFPSARRDPKTPHLTDPRTTWNRIKKNAGIKDLHLHDLRRTAASWMAMQGTSLQIVGRSLGHTSPEATAVYSRLTIDPVRAAVLQATMAMQEAGKAKEESKPKGKQK